ncbi:MAG: transketolase, partial [Actinobacteria bacterium]|nr:transketolase [Actinomycetota bacterium]
MTDPDLELRAINTIRGLAMDLPQAANSGHQGTAMALAPLAHVLWTRIMDYDPADPHWFDRDRFVLSAGHASVLLYAMLHLTGYDLSLDDLKAFRQWGSRTPGHPERNHTAGVEVTTGPLGQGVGNGVGLGMAEQYLRTRFGADVVDHHTFVICGDGDLSEGVSHEAASLAGHLGLGRLVYVYDDNHITIDGPTELALTDDAPKRFEAYGWHVQDLGEAANDLDVLERALRAAMAVEDQPSLVVVRSHIAYPSPGLTDSPKAHGKAFSDDEIRATKEVMGMPPDETFFVPDDVAAYYAEAGRRGASARAAWQQRVDGFGGDRAELAAVLADEGLPGWRDALPTWEPGEKVATRVASGKVFAALVPEVPGLLGGGADLTGNTGTELKDVGVLSKAEPGGRQVHFGIREHAMGATMNGMAAHGGVLPVGGTFFVFSDYMRPAVRLAAIARHQVIYSWTHDSVGVGEDGPTHQPVEQLAALRAIPNHNVFRPADAMEAAECWQLALASTKTPSTLALTRQNVPALRTEFSEDNLCAFGAYEIATASDEARVTIFATGSEVEIAIAARAALEKKGHPTRVVSVPCFELFEKQDAAYRAAILGKGGVKVAIEAGIRQGWDAFIGADGIFVGMHGFGASAPAEQLYQHFGITADATVKAVEARLA